MANYIKLWGSPFFSASAIGLVVGIVLYLSLEYEGKGKTKVKKK